MAYRNHPVVAPEPRATRIVRWTAFLLTVALIAALGIARSAQALTVPAGGGTAIAAAAPPSPESASEAEEEGEEGEEAGECEEEAGVEDVEEVEECESESASAAPEQCLLSTATATVSASSPANKVRLAIHYTGVSPATVAIAYFLRGSKGPLTMAGDKKHFGTNGVFHDTESLGRVQMEKVMAAKRFTVQLRPVDAPGYCHRFLESHLTARHATHDGLTWSDPEAEYRPSHRA
jgi:hypothetical protein